MPGFAVTRLGTGPGAGLTSWLLQAHRAAADGAAGIVHVKGFTKSIALPASSPPAAALATSPLYADVLARLARTPVIVFDGDDFSAAAFTFFVPGLLASGSATSQRVLAFVFASEEARFLESWRGAEAQAAAGASGSDRRTADGPAPQSPELHYVLVDDSAVEARPELLDAAVAAALSPAARAELLLGAEADNCALHLPPAPQHAPFCPSPLALAISDAQRRYAGLGVFACICTGRAAWSTSGAMRRSVLALGSHVVCSAELAIASALWDVASVQPWDVLMCERVKLLSDGSEQRQRCLIEGGTRFPGVSVEEAFR